MDLLRLGEWRPILALHAIGEELVELGRLARRRTRNAALMARL
jgi:hypothetical protein